MEISERRRSPRIKVSLPISLEHRGKNHHYEDEVTKDISATGLRINMDSFFPMNSNFLIKMRFPEANKSIEGLARVAWSQHLNYSNQYEAGLQIVEINPVYKRWLEEYIQINQAFGN